MVLAAQKTVQELGLTDSLGSEVVGNEYSHNHLVLLPSLLAETEYFYQIEACNNDGLVQGNFRFGSYSIKENMAALIESEFNDVLGYNNFPYKTVELLNEFILEEKKLGKRELIYLCEISLNSYNGSSSTFISFSHHV